METTETGITPGKQIWAALSAFFSFTVDQYSGFVFIVAAPFIAKNILPFK